MSLKAVIVPYREDRRPSVERSGPETRLMDHLAAAAWGVRR